MIKKRKAKSKKAISLMLSYVLLIVISMSIAGMVYGFLRFRAQLPEEILCPEETTLIIRDYSCDNGQKTIDIEVQNKGLFNINGFFIRATNSTGISPYIPLKHTGEGAIEGRYDFGDLNTPLPLKPTDPSTTTQFSYFNYQPLLIVEIQPFILRDNKIGICQNTVTLNIDNSKNCN